MARVSFLTRIAKRRCAGAREQNPRSHRGRCQRLPSQRMAAGRGERLTATMDRRQFLFQGFVIGEEHRLTQLRRPSPSGPDLWHVVCDSVDDHASRERLPPDHQDFGLYLFGHMATGCMGQNGPSAKAIIGRLKVSVRDGCSEERNWRDRKACRSHSPERDTWVRKEPRVGTSVRLKSPVVKVHQDHGGEESLLFRPSASVGTSFGRLKLKVVPSPA